MTIDYRSPIIEHNSYFTRTYTAPGFNQSSPYQTMEALFRPDKEHPITLSFDRLKALKPPNFGNLTENKTYSVIMALSPELVKTQLGVNIDLNLVRKSSKDATTSLIAAPNDVLTGLVNKSIISYEISGMSFGYLGMPVAQILKEKIFQSLIIVEWNGDKIVPIHAGSEAMKIIPAKDLKKLGIVDMETWKDKEVLYLKQYLTGHEAGLYPQAKR